MIKLQKPELVAPAGNLEKLKYAIEYGADAVYCGIPDFSLRVRINQFEKEDILTAIKYAHSKGKKIYITTNIFAHNKHIARLEEFLTWLSHSHVVPDAFISSDPGVINVIKKILPEVNIHLSTQANCTNWQAAKFWYDLGVKRVVLGREVTLEEIKEIKKRVPKLELEVFVHGAMCMAYSGRCFLSAWLAPQIYSGQAPSEVEGMKRSANLGDCAQSCRWKYNLVEEMRPGEYMPVEQDAHGTYLLNSKDLCLIDYLKELADAGVSAFKIEGRAKSVHYIATTVKAYREVIDSQYDKKIINKQKKELQKSTNRGYTTGFLLGNEEASRQNFENRSVESEWDFVGEVISPELIPLCRGVFRSKRDGVFIKPHNVFNVNDEIEAITPIGTNKKIKIKKIFSAKNGKEVSEAHGGTDELFILNIVRQKLPAMSVLRKRK